MAALRFCRAFGFVTWAACFLCVQGGVSRSSVDFAIARGLAFLARAQRSDGSFRYTKYQVAAQGLAGLAFLAAGHTPRYGRYSANLRLGLRRLLAYQRPDGYFDDGASRMYGHGFATLYLAQVVGMWGVPDEERRIRRALTKAIRRIETAQDEFGGWDYEPEPGGVSDCSVTVCQTMALRAARNIGIYVDENVVKRALAYVRRAQAENGGFRYRIGKSGGFQVLNKVTLGCSAAGVCILNGLGEYDSERVRRGLNFLRRYYRNSFGIVPIPFFYYTHYYAAQAFYVSGAPDWQTYYEYIANVLINKQEEDGSWQSPRGGRIIQPTAMAVFILAVPRAVLPIIQRD